jgi:uncharacterized protein (TIGR03083 family)
MEDREYVDAVAAESNALADSVAVAELDTPVPSCPAWTMEDLGAHIGLVQRWAAAVVGAGAKERPSFGEPPSVTSARELSEWCREGTAAVVDALTRVDPDAAVWTFSGDGRARFWFRRQAHEAAVHRWDAQNAVATAAPVEARLAADGVDEWLALLASRRGGGAAAEGEAESTLHLHCTDVDGEWLVRRSHAGLDIERVHAKGDVAARGAASDLNLYLWGRIPADSLEVFGDLALLESLRTAGRR